MYTSFICDSHTARMDSVQRIAFGEIKRKKNGKFCNIFLQMTRDTGGLLGKKKEKEREVKAEKVVTNDHPGTCFIITNTLFCPEICRVSTFIIAKISEHVPPQP